MKFLILALTVAVAFSTTIATTSLAYSTTFNTGTKLNSTCSLATTLTGTYAAATASTTKVQQHGLWLASVSTVTTASASDMMIFAMWGTTSTDAAVLTTTAYATAPTATGYGSSGSAWTSSGSITVSASSITAGASAGIYNHLMTFALPFTLVNATTSNFTKTSLSWNYWIKVNEGTTAYTYNDAAWTGAATGTTTIDLKTCTTGMSAITSGSSLVSSIISSFMALSFF